MFMLIEHKLKKVLTFTQFSVKVVIRYTMIHYEESQNEKFSSTN